MSNKMVPVFEVFIDSMTGKWLKDPSPTLENTNLVEWQRKADCGATRYRIIQLEGKTCALIIHVTQSRSNFYEVFYDF